jgi:VIT1/CCC1 family predicted Fe2+/Mn2+ transporter
MISFITVLYGSQALFSLYNISLCIISITNLRGYEETSQKAAQYSQTAADELKKTRTTQASALLSVRSRLLNFISILIPILGSFLPVICRNFGV